MDYAKLRLSDNFWLGEFIRSGDYVLKPHLHQVRLVKMLVDNVLQPLRDQFGEINITSGIRDKFIYEKLRAEGYPVSHTTDHSYLDPDVNQFGVGAADIVFKHVTAKEVYEYIQEQRFPIGQCIYYPEHNFLHISNMKTAIFSEWFASTTLKNRQRVKYFIYR